MSWNGPGWPTSRAVTDDRHAGAKALPACSGWVRPAVSQSSDQERAPRSGASWPTHAARSPLDVAQRRQDHQGEGGAHDRRRLAPHPRRHADRRREPDAGRGGEPVDAAMLVVLEYGPGAEEPDACDQALEHAGHVAGGHAGLERDEDEEGGPERDEHVGPHASLLAGAVPLEAEEAA